MGETFDEANVDEVEGWRVTPGVDSLLEIKMMCVGHYEIKAPL